MIAAQGWRASRTALQAETVVGGCAEALHEAARGLVHQELESSTTVPIHVQYSKIEVQRIEARPSTAVSTRQISNITIAGLAGATAPILTPIRPAMT